jgi:hypothetical protein
VSYFLVLLHGDPEEYRFEEQQDAEDAIQESPNGGEWFEIVSLDTMDPDLI